MVVWYSTSETEIEIVRLYGKTPSGMAEGVFYRLQFPDTAKCSAPDFLLPARLSPIEEKPGQKLFRQKPGNATVIRLLADKRMDKPMI